MMNRQFQLAQENKLNDANNDSTKDLVLCLYCKRTKGNGLSCIGKCVADNEY